MRIRTITLISLGVAYSLIPPIVIALKYNGDDITYAVIFAGLLLTALPYCLGFLGGVAWKEEYLFK